MNLQSKKYKIRLIIICVIFIVALVLGIIAVNEDVQKSIEVIQSTPEEECQEVIKQIFSVKEGQSITKQQALDNLEEMSSMFQAIFKYSEISAILIFSYVLAGPFMGIMMYFIFTNWIINKIWKDIKPWMPIVMSILIFLLLLQFLYSILLIVGIFGQLIFIIYSIYKYIKTKHTEDKDDVIKTK